MSSSLSKKARRRLERLPKDRDPVESGNKVYLRYPIMEDAKEYTALMRKSRSHLRPWAYPCETVEQYQTWLARANPRTHRRFFVCERDTDEIVGYVALNEIVYGLLCSAYIGYQIGAPFAQQGYMTEALELVLRHSFRTLKLHRLEANIQPENIASIAVAHKVGFVREGYSPRYLKIGGRWCDHERWAILREDWEKRSTRASATPAHRNTSTSTDSAGSGADRASKPPVRVSAKAIVIRNGKLLVLRCIDSKGNWFALPGGGQEHGESLPETVRRECMEEVAAEVEVGTLAFVRDYVVANHEQTAFPRDTHQVELMFLCTVSDDYEASAGSGPDSTQTGVEWLAIDQLHRYRLFPRALSEHLPKVNDPKDAPPLPIYLGDVN